MNHHRKTNRLAGYDYSQPGAYFITVCTENRRCVLSRIVGGDALIAPQVLLTSVGAVAEKYLRTIPGIDRYVIMPNHVHMILRISAEDVRRSPVWSDAPVKASIPSLVRSWKKLTSKELGESIWQRSYYDHIIRDQREYIEIARYIEENPAKWQEDNYFQSRLSTSSRIRPKQHSAY